MSLFNNIIKEKIEIIYILKNTVIFMLFSWTRLVRKMYLFLTFQSRSIMQILWSCFAYYMWVRLVLPIEHPRDSYVIDNCSNKYMHFRKNKPTDYIFNAFKPLLNNFASDSLMKNTKEIWQLISDKFCGNVIKLLFTHGQCYQFQNGWWLVRIYPFHLHPKEIIRYYVNYVTRV